jgi:membrane protein implicated in regulation of membrane protease activity
MGNPVKPPDEPEAFSPDERRALDAWPAKPPAAGFAERVMDRADNLRTTSATKNATATATGRATSSPPRTRAEGERRRRRRSALATVLGAVVLSVGGGVAAWQLGPALGLQNAAHAGLTIYLAALAFGGVLLIGSLVGGHDHGGAEGDAGMGGAHHAGDAHDHAHHEHDSQGGPTGYLWFIRPLLSLRFWIFGLTFFGLTGSILSGLRLATPSLTAVLAIMLGLTTGYIAARLFQALARQTVGEISSQGGHIGREGRLLLPVSKSQRGKMRAVVGGVATDVIVETDSEAPLPAGVTVLVVGMRGTIALVERSPAGNGSAQEGDKT